LFFGGEIANNKTPKVVKQADAWERFKLEERGNGNFVIRSVNNTILTAEG
jgi:hypothetical protein